MLKIDFDSSVEYTNRRYMLLSRNYNSQRYMVCYVSPEQREWDLIGRYNLKDLQCMRFISSSLLLIKMQYRYRDRFGRQSGEPENYWSVVDTNGCLRTAP